MVCIKSLFLTNQLTSMFSLPSTTSSQVQTERQQSSTAAVSTTCKRKQQQRNGGTTTSVLFLGLLKLGGVVSIIILITTTGSPTPVSALSIAAVSHTSNVYGNGKGGNGSKLDIQQQHHHHPGQTPQLSVLSGKDAKGNGSTTVINLPIGGHLGHKLQQLQHMQVHKKQQLDSPSTKNHGQVVVNRSGGGTRVTSNQDITTLAVAVDNSSSVAVANINSSHNIVNVMVGSKNYQNHSDPFTGNEKHRY